jgi:hypothetical protein
MTKPTTDQIREAIRTAAGGSFFPIDSWPSRERLQSLALQEDVLFADRGGSGGLVGGPVRVVVDAAVLLADAERAGMVPVVLAVVYGDAEEDVPPAETRPDAVEPGVQVDGQGLEPAAEEPPEGAEEPLPPFSS